MLRAMAKRSALFWAGVVGASACGLCSASAVGLMLLGAVVDAPATASDARPATAPTPRGRIPTGHTPGFFPGMPGWLPSGRGTAIPPATFEGEPRGLWWAPRMNLAQTSCQLVVFLPGGVYADGPRPGGPLLVDLEGQRAENGVTGVGTYSVSGGTITMAHDGYRSTDPLSDGEDDAGPWFAIRHLKYRPVSPVSSDTLIGTWTAGGSRFVFHADGTFESGQVSVELGAGAAHQGRWTLDGYLLMLEPAGAPGWITTVGTTVDERFLILGNALHARG